MDGEEKLQIVPTRRKFNNIEEKILVKRFGSFYREKIGESYPPTWGRDLKMFGDLLNFYELEKLEELLEIYFETESRIYSIPFFKAQLANVLQEWVRRKENKPTAMNDNESWRFE